MSHIKEVEPSSPFVEGFIRFVWDEQQAGQVEQGDGFELLAHTHAVPTGDQFRRETHPLAEKLLSRDGARQEDQRHLDEIPIRFLGRTVDDVLGAEYRSTSLFGDVMCRGDGSKAMREGEAVSCAGPRQCQFAKTVGCHLHVRMHAAIEGSDDPYAVFEFQSTSPNTYRALKSKLMVFEKLAGDLMGLPLRLTTWKKSTEGSSYKPFYCANLQLREGQSLAEAKDQAKTAKQELGLDHFPDFGCSNDGAVDDDVVSVAPSTNATTPPVADQSKNPVSDMVSALIAAKDDGCKSRLVKTSVCSVTRADQKPVVAVDQAHSDADVTV